jgi:hypothetical protein
MNATFTPHDKARAAGSAPPERRRAGGPRARISALPLFAEWPIEARMPEAPRRLRPVSLILPVAAALTVVALYIGVPLVAGGYALLGDLSRSVAVAALTLAAFVLVIIRVLLATGRSRPLPAPPRSRPDPVVPEATWRGSATRSLVGTDAG